MFQQSAKVIVFFVLLALSYKSEAATNLTDSSGPVQNSSPNIWFKDMCQLLIDDDGEAEEPTIASVPQANPTLLPASFVPATNGINVPQHKVFYSFGITPSLKPNQAPGSSLVPTGTNPTAYTMAVPVNSIELTPSPALPACNLLKILLVEKAISLGTTGQRIPSTQATPLTVTARHIQAYIKASCPAKMVEGSILQGINANVCSSLVPPFLIHQTSPFEIREVLPIGENPTLVIDIRVIILAFAILLLAIQTAVFLSRNGMGGSGRVRASSRRK